MGPVGKQQGLMAESRVGWSGNMPEVSLQFQLTQRPWQIRFCHGTAANFHHRLVSITPPTVPQRHEDPQAPHAGVCHVRSQNKSVLFGWRNTPLRMNSLSYLPGERDPLLPTVDIKSFKSICKEIWWSWCSHIGCRYDTIERYGMVSALSKRSRCW